MAASPNRFHWSSLLQFAISGLGLLTLLPAALTLGVLGIVYQVTGRSRFGDSLSLLSLASVALFVSFLLVPGVVLALFRLIGRPLPNWQMKAPYLVASLSLLLWPVVALVGTMASHNDRLQILLPPLQLLAIAIPVWWFVETGKRGLPSGGLQKSWGILGFGLVIVPPLSLVLELLVIALLVVFAAVWIAFRPDLVRQLQQIANQIQMFGSDPQQILNALRPFISQQIAVFGAIAVGAVLMPMLEETFKPLVIWFLAPGSRMTPAEGFTAGLISGGAFALMESLSLISNVSDSSWVAVVTARVGTALLHTTTTGLLGWALVSALVEGRYLRLGITYLISVTLHGLWNAFGLLMGMNVLLPANGADSLLSRLSIISPVVLGVLAVLLFAILEGANRRLRRDLEAVETGAEPPEVEAASEATEENQEEAAAVLENGVEKTE